MKHKAPSKLLTQVLAYDLGGTKVAVGVVNSKGKILEELRVPVVLEQGKDAVIQQLADLGNQLIKRFPKIKKVGIGSAGPLDPIKGVFLDPTNFKSSKGSWGKVPITSILTKKLKRPVFLDNDAAAAMAAEHWLGAAKGYDNAMILTLGTGLGTGMVCNGILERAGRHLHPEGGHMIIGWNDKTAPCGCGNLGCAEAYLSGKNFEARTRVKLGNATITNPEIANLARKGDARAKEAFEEYSQLMATTIRNFAVLYSPEIVVFTGSFAATQDLWIQQTRTHLERLMVRRRVGVDLMPELAISELDNTAGLLGAAYVAIQGTGILRR